MRVRNLMVPAAAALLAASSLMVPGCGCAPHAYYTSDAAQLEGVDYEGTLQAARAAGYEVDGPYYVGDKQPGGLHPDDMPELEDRFGSDFRIYYVTLYHSPTSFIEVTVPDPEASDPTTVAFFDSALPTEARFPIESLPPDAWIIDQLVLVLGVDEAAAGIYLQGVKDQIVGGEVDIPTIAADEPPLCAAIRAALVAGSTSIAGSETGGDGWYKESYLSGEEKLGAIDFIVQNSEIRRDRMGAEYEIKLDRLGGVRLMITLDSGDTIPEAEYRGVFKEMFEDMELPAEVVDELEFSYSPGT